jgi:DNA-binding transcriptional LysR family regulator
MQIECCILSKYFRIFEIRNFQMTMAARQILTPQALHMLSVVAQEGSLAAAARALGVVPSALTYRVRALEDALDVLLFDRSSRKAVLTEAGHELIAEGNRILAELDAVANRVKRVATGWEPQITIAFDSLISQRVLQELCERFYELDPPTQIKLSAHTLSGTWEALGYGEADLAIGGVVEQMSTGIQSKALGEVGFVFAVAPHHPLANAAEPISDEVIGRYRAVAVADSARRNKGVTIGLLPGQQVLTVPTMPMKLDAQIRGLGCGFLPECLARPHIEIGQLVQKRTQRAARVVRLSYGWRAEGRGHHTGKALSWWLEQLEQPTLRHAMLFSHGTPGVQSSTRRSKR